MTDHDEELDMIAIAKRFPTVKRDQVPELEEECERLNTAYSGSRWCVERSQFDVSEEDAEFANWLLAKQTYGRWWTVVGVTALISVPGLSAFPSSTDSSLLRIKRRTVR